MAKGFVDNWELTGMEQMYYTVQHTGNEGGAVMEEMVKRPSGEDGLLQDQLHSISQDEARFIKIANDSTIRTSLLVRLQELGLLSGFLEAENETI